MSNQDTFSVEDLPVVIEEVDWSGFDYPIGSFTGYPEWNDGEYHHQQGSWNYGPVFGEEESDIPEKDMVDYKQFDKVYYAVEGEPDYEEWTFLVKHKNGYYVFFNAGCDYTGFDCQGGGDIRYSKDGNKMWLLGLTDEVRRKIESNHKN